MNKQSGRLEKTIVLVGLMGAGKTSIGRRLAERLHVPFQDADQVIETRENSSISDIFANKGEAYFRTLERQVIAEDLLTAPHVLALGGGAYMDESTRHTIAQYGIAVWLKADIDVLHERVSRRNTRPLLEQGDKREILTRLMEERYPVYALSDHVVETSHQPHDVVVHTILEQLKDHVHTR